MSKINRYDRQGVEINYWFISLEDIRHIVYLFSGRIDSDEIKNDISKTIPYKHICLEYSSKNNICIDIDDDRDMDEIEKEIKLRIKAKDDLFKIKMKFSKTYHMQNSFDDIAEKEISLELNFESGFSWMGCSGFDKDGQLLDWFNSTYYQINELKKRFEIKNKYRELLVTNLSFDPFGKIKEEIFEKEKMEKEIRILQNKATKIELNINGDNNFSNNSSIKNNNSFNKIKQNNPQERNLFIRIFFSMIGSLFVAYLVYRFGWNK